MTDNPYLRGAYAPVAAETSGTGLEVIGEVPRDLRGIYVRNGPNRRFEASGRYHWFDGDGMLHATHVEDGQVHYRSRWVDTPSLRQETEAGHALWRGLMEPTVDNPTPYKDTGNTDVVLHGDRLYALWYICGAAHRVHPLTLQTEGEATFGRERPLRLSAHAKVDEHSGELMFFDYGPRPPFMRYGVIGADGQLKHSTDIALPGPRLPHDMAITERYSVLMDLPVFFRPEALQKRKWIVDYHPNLPARFGILPRHAAGDAIRWFEAEPCYIYHVVNAWEDEDEVVMLACRCADPTPPVRPEDGKLGRMLANLRLTASLHRWRFNLKTGETKEEALDDLSAEFPTIDARALGRRNRHSYHVRIPSRTTLEFDALVKYDLEDGTREVLPFGAGRLGSEAVFAPRDASTQDDDGYLLSYVHDPRLDRSELWIIDARDLTAGPRARVVLPARVPLGFHACWVPGERLEGLA